MGEAEDGVGSARPLPNSATFAKFFNLSLCVLGLQNGNTYLLWLV